MRRLLRLEAGGVHRPQEEKKSHGKEGCWQLKVPGEALVMSRAPGIRSQGEYRWILLIYGCSSYQADYQNFSSVKLSVIKNQIHVPQSNEEWTWKTIQTAKKAGEHRLSKFSTRLQLEATVEGACSSNSGVPVIVADEAFIERLLNITTST